MSLDFHPIANLFPLMGDAELADLANDIRAHGLHQSVILHCDGSILDGRNRYRACESIGVEPDYETYAGDDPLGYVISRNLYRRHLTESQRAMVAAKIANLPHGGDRKSDQAPNLGVAVLQAAQMLNVGRGTVETARQVNRDAAPNIISAVERGEVTVSAAAKAIKTTPKDEQENWTAADIRRVAKEVALNGVKLPTPKQAEAISKEQGGAYVVGSDGKFHVSLTSEEGQLKDDWFAFKERIVGWRDFDVTPERALASIPSYQRKNIDDELEAAKKWLQQFDGLWRKQNAI